LLYFGRVVSGPPNVHGLWTLEMTPSPELHQNTLLSGSRELV
jgi:hypothetical protein